MRKILLASAMTMGAMMFAQQRPIITKWQTSSEQDKQIAINNRGTATFTYEKVGDPSITGNGTLNDESKTTIHLPFSGEYIVKITPTSSTFALMMGLTQPQEAAELKEVSQWGNHNWGTTVSNLFTNCTNLVITATDVPDFSTVEDMSNMFYKASSITDIPNINQWNTSNVRDMSNMFNQAIGFNSDISSWNTSKVRTMARMFAGVNASNPHRFNQNISNWDTSNTTDMSAMFRDNTSFNQDLSKWNTNKVMNLNSMFDGATAFNQDISHFDISNLDNSMRLNYFIDNSGLSCENYTKLLKAWAENSKTPQRLRFSAQGVRYGDAGKTYRDKLINEKSWIIASTDVYDTDCTAGLSTKEISPVDLKIINPVKNTLVIRASAKINKVEIYATTGQLVKTFTGNQADISALAKGIYILKIETDKGTQTTKIVKE